jgi:uncharacterized protein YyaL (SSP411 family)
VHWRAWGPDALAEAKAANKPILLSVGYAACHWCHVMAHESFENADIAAVMNDLFVNIKVDREERPDVDAIYMRALHSLGEQGGWPLTMFLDSEARPFWGGTYFPPDAALRPARLRRRAARGLAHLPRGARQGRPQRRPAGRRAQGTPGLSHAPTSTTPCCPISPAAWSAPSTACTAACPVRPKFPQWNFFWLLWRGAIRYGHEPARHAVETTLTNICQGGIYDHLGGGFARYSVDAHWLVPHFEKMLYDNALLIDLMCEVYREGSNELYARRIDETAQWVLREMIAEGGGFAASLDADSEGEEGKFYVWTKREIVEVLGDADAEISARPTTSRKAGNWEGHTILNRLRNPIPRSPSDEKALSTCASSCWRVAPAASRPAGTTR